MLWSIPGSDDVRFSKAADRLLLESVRKDHDEFLAALFSRLGHPSHRFVSFYRISDTYQTHQPTLWKLNPIF